MDYAAANPDGFLTSYQQMQRSISYGWHGMSLTPAMSWKDIQYQKTRLVRYYSHSIIDGHL